MKTKSFIILIGILGIFQIVVGQTKSRTDLLKDDLKRIFSLVPQTYVVYQTKEKITIDGKAKEESWQKAEWTKDFNDIEGAIRPKPTYRTRAKMLWDDQYLYVMAELEDQNIWAYQKNHDDIVFLDNDFEIFIDPDNDTKNYFEFETNAIQTVFDLFLPEPYRTESFPLHNWDFKGVKVATVIDGTLNNGKDKDKKWTVEIAIPFSSVSFGMGNGKPKLEQPWRLGFSRVEWNTEWKDGKYEKIKDPQTGKNLPENNWVWSPVGAISMHMPERWGYVKFSANEVGTTTEEFKIPDIEFTKEALWAIFYREEQYYSKNKKYCADLNEIGIDIENLYDTSLYKLSLKTTAMNYEAVLDSNDGKTKLIINGDGKLITTISK
jgi:hypothetical protein